VCIKAALLTARRPADAMPKWLIRIALWIRRRKRAAKVAAKE